MSLLSFLGSTYTTTHFISQIYRRKEFIDFITNINDGPRSLDVIYKFTRNFILKKCDLIVLPLLNTPENINIFKNDSLSTVEQSKLFFGKMVNHVLSSIDLEEYMLMFLTSSSSGFGAGLLFENQAEFKKKIVEFAITQLNNIPTLDSVTCPTDVYKQVVEYYAILISKIFYVFSLPICTEIDQTPLLDTVCDMMGNFNSFYEYNSKIYHDNNSSSSSDEDDEDDKERPLKNLKRANAMEGLPSKESDSKRHKK